jgi:hypothetical protein
MASQLLTPLRLAHELRLGQTTDDHFGPFGFGAGSFMPVEAPAPVFSSSLRERVLLLANQLVISASEPTMSTDRAAIVRALCHTLRNVHETPPTPTRFSPPPMFMDGPMTQPTTVLSAHVWASPSSTNADDQLRETSRSPTMLAPGHFFDQFDEHAALSLLTSDIVCNPNLCMMTSTVAPPATSTLPPASLKRRIDIDDDFSIYSQDFSTPTKKAAHGIYFSQLTDASAAVRSALPPPKSVSQVDLAQLASDWRSILGADIEEATHTLLEEHVGENFWHVLGMA